MALTGGCICGEVRYEINEGPLFVHACHCSDCQRFSGSAFVILLGVPEAGFSVRGETARVSNPTPSGAGYDAWHCPQCATVLWSKYHFAKMALVVVRGGTLDDPSLAPPTYHIFGASKQPWVVLPDDALVFDGWLDPAQAWSEATRERMGALAQG